MPGPLQFDYKTFAEFKYGEDTLKLKLMNLGFSFHNDYKTYNIHRNAITGTISEVKLQCYFSSRAPKLFEYCHMGAIFDTVKLDFGMIEGRTDKDAGQYVPKWECSLEKVMIRFIQVGKILVFDSSDILDAKGKVKRYHGRSIFHDGVLGLQITLSPAMGYVMRVKNGSKYSTDSFSLDGNVQKI